MGITGWVLWSNPIQEPKICRSHPICQCQVVSRFGLVQGISKRLRNQNEVMWNRFSSLPLTAVQSPNSLLLPNLVPLKLVAVADDHTKSTVNHNSRQFKTSGQVSPPKDAQYFARCASTADPTTSATWDSKHLQGSTSTGLDRVNCS